MQFSYSSASPSAQFLLDARFSQTLQENIPSDLYPGSPIEAFEIQSEIVLNLTRRYESEVCGFKLACTNDLAMKLLNVSEPFPGRLMTHSTHESGIEFNPHEFCHRVVELEFGFRIDQNVPPSDIPYNANTIKPYIGEFLPGIEIVDHRYEDFTQVGALALIADNAIHGQSVFGKACSDWREVDLKHHPVSLFINDTLFSTGTGINVLGDPLNVVAWLQNYLAQHSQSLQCGDQITTGTACDVYSAQPGDIIKADFGQLGEVSCSFNS